MLTATSKIDELGKRMKRLPAVLRGPANVRNTERAALQLGERLGGLKETHVIGLQVRSKRGKVRDLQVLVSPSGAQVVRPGQTSAATTFVLSETDWAEIATGKVAPAAKYLAGRVMVRGDCRLAGRIYQRLTGDSTGRVR